MYTLKFIYSYEDGSNVTDVISCDHYSIYERKNGITTVTTYPTMLDQDGVERHLVHNTADDAFYTRCYVENIMGDTIFVIKVNAAQKGLKGLSEGKGGE